MPGTIQDDMKKKTSTSAEYRKKIIEYYIQYSPGATWSSLTGGLYYWECPKAVVAAKRFIKKTPGNYVISSHDHAQATRDTTAYRMAGNFCDVITFNYFSWLT